MKKWLALLLVLCMAFSFAACTDLGYEESYTEENTETVLDIDGSYTTKEDVALYIYTYGELPDNYLTKNEARSLGWEGGSVEDYAGDGTAIGGDKFGNKEGNLPTVSGRQYYECDIDTVGSSKRGAQRIVYSNDGLIFVTYDHYATFYEIDTEGVL